MARYMLIIMKVNSSKHTGDGHVLHVCSGMDGDDVAYLNQGMEVFSVFQG